MIRTLVNEILSEQGLMLKAGSAVDAILISAPSSTKNGSDTRGPETHQMKKEPAAVWIDEDPVSRVDEEHRADHDTVCTGQPLNGAQGFTRNVKSPSVSANGGRHASKAGRPPCQQTLTTDMPQVAKDQRSEN
ncbi:hypothetical protein QFZ96_001717 [Paraburkholderia youngii]